ncbi:hypothetical protein BJX76DRAFT_150577 [Aspergillus varians]
MDGEVQSVLRCGLCNKPFDKQSALKRHGYYCRSRRAGPATRSRSCISCARRKARCDNRRPGCSQCSSKGVECHYPIPASRNRQNAVPSIETDSGSGVGSSQGISRLGDIIPDPSLALAVSDPDPGFADIGLLGEGEYLDWDYNALDISFPDSMNTIPQMNEKTGQYPYSLPSSLTGTIPHSTPASSSSSSTLAIQIQSQQPMSSPKISIPSLPYLPRLLIHRPHLNAGGKRTSTLIMHTLKSYLLMLLRDNALPPFIHPYSVSSFGSPSQSPPSNAEDKAETVPQSNLGYRPLANCIALVQTLGNSSQERSRKPFWANVQVECERLLASDQLPHPLDRWDLLGAIQALSVYVLIRLDEGETEENNLDFLLLAAVTIIAKQLSGFDAASNMHSALYDENLEVSWKEWVFEESRRRTAIIYRIINMLVYFEPPTRCDMPADLILAPLPAKKPLWEAGDGVLWKAEVEREPGIHHTAFGLAATGELVRLDQGRTRGTLHRGDTVLSHVVLDAATVSRTPADWEEWCSGMDGFGSLVMLAAALVG